MSYKGSMTLARTPRGSHVMSWAIAVALGASLLSGVVCGGGPEDEQAMECCQRDGIHCNMPKKTEDCCKPDRGSENPAGLSISAGTTIKQQLEKAVPAPGLPGAGLVFHVAHVTSRVPVATSFLEPLPNVPQFTPLLN